MGKRTVSATQAKEYVRHLAGAAYAMTGSLHPNEFDDARQYVRTAQRVLNSIIDGKIRIKQKRSK